MANPPPSTAPTTADGFLADRQLFWNATLRFTARVIVFLVILLAFLWWWLV